MTAKFRAAFSCLMLLLCAGGFTSCARNAKPGGPRVVFVSIPPQKFIVDRIAGGRMETHVLITPGQSPHTFTPEPRQIADLSRASLYFTIGIPFEETVTAKAAGQNRGLRFVDMGRGVARAEEAEHDLGHDDEHGQGELDPHIWLDPRNAITMAENTAAALGELDPAHRRDFEKNKQALIADLKALDKKLSAMLSPYKGRRFYVYHPAFGYFARAYGLEQTAVETGGKEPAARTLNALIRQAQRDNVRVIFVQPQFSQRSAERVAHETGGVVVPIDNLAEDYITNMERMAREIVKGFSR